jgi:cysteine desulfurase family protein (TIGR01976 family)
MRAESGSLQSPIMVMTPSSQSLEDIRSQFPALGRVEGGRPAAYLDGAGGTQVPQLVIGAMTSTLAEGVSNLGGGFGPSNTADKVTAEARQAIGDLFNADPGEITFGQNMTSLTFAMSRALANDWGDGDAIVLTSLDHDANFTPWVRAAEDRGVDVRVADFDPSTGLLDPANVIALLDENVRLVAVCLTSNSIGTTVDIPPICAAAHAVDALVYVDAVHAVPHHLIDVDQLDCDFLAASVYKFFGPHTGVLYGKAEHLSRLDAYKVRPAPSDPPGKWETGTQSFESLAGVVAAVDYMASLGSPTATRRKALASAYGWIVQHEQDLATRFLDGINSLDGVRLHGVQEVNEQRGPTFAISVDGHTPQAVAERLASEEIYVWSGHYYAINVMTQLGVLDDGGLVRIGFVHYNTPEEVDRTLAVLADL